MNVLVTGGAGFIGSNLCEELVSNGHNIVCLDNLSTGKETNVFSLKEKRNFRLVKGDCNSDDLKRLFKNNEFDMVFHYAAVVGVKRTIENPLLVMNDLVGIKNILELSRKGDVKKVVFASSSEVYGEPVELPEKEEGIVNPKINYAVVKLAGEKYMSSYYSTYGLRTTSLRFFNVYGPKQISSAYGFVAGIFIEQVLKGKSPTIFGDGMQTRDFTFIEDNIEASLIAMEKKASDGESINIGTGKATTILELANTVIKAAGKEKKIKPVFLEPRPKDILHRCASVEKMRMLLDYGAETELLEGLKKTISWYEKAEKLEGRDK